jgi:hypothetical protein
MLSILKYLKKLLGFFVSVIPRLGDCVVITLKCKFVILNEVKNLIRSMCCKTEILLLMPQNDITTQSLDRGIRGRELDFPVKPENDIHWNRVRDG